MFGTDMENQIKNSTSICIRTLINNVIVHLAGHTPKNSSVIKVNNDNLATNGDLYFLPSLKAWKGVVECENVCEEKCSTILQHFLHIRNINTNDKSDAEIAEEVFQSLVTLSQKWLIKIERCSLQNEKICLFLNRSALITNTIKTAMEQGRNFGRSLPSTKTICLKAHEDKQSELTTVRLHLIRNVTEKLLDLHGYKVSEEESSSKYVFTTKSEGKVDEDYEKSICGVVKSAQSNTKEVSLSWEKHIENKISELQELNEHKYFETEKDSMGKDSFLRNIAKATAIFELLAVKPSRPVFIGHNPTADRSISNTKGATFILYNTARIATIIEKYENKKLKGEYPELTKINDVDFSLLNQEEEWELVYNFILGYQEMIKDCLKFQTSLQPSPQVLCLFLSRLCQKFSIYYRRIRVLTEPYDHLILTMNARLYMLHALQIILENALSILDINSISHM